MITLVEAQNGNIKVTSTPGQGSCFTITLPYIAVCSLPPITLQQQEQQPILKQQIFQPLPDSNEPESESRVPRSISENLPLATSSLQPSLAESEPIEQPLCQRQKPLILLAEDNKTNIETFSLYLTHSGYDLMVANDGIEVIKLAQLHQPDLILMDIQMPGMDGLEAIDKIRHIPEIMHTPIIALTALAMPGDREMCLASGANEYLSKPAKLKQLRQTIQQLIGDRSKSLAS